MPSRELNLQQIKEKGIHKKIKDKEVLHGLVEIAAHCGMCIAQIRRMIKNHGFPATRAPTHRARYFTTKTNIREWITRGHLNLVETNDWDKKIMHR